ncbi:MAG: 30S ribosome-binding factor RbfA [Gemmatimonadetes bacterium]|uniref:Ribosome-binding factor A n=1 Tax=Candidatus Kutchimonas denitrificans TaxID=3056748 RepID=A0AAE4ZBL3_9BACT|nr:30S ribosome-binding factor RbfA [Gemmatimonadota bacterium]NIR76212.1 30S ribosome-binding factor RbfA [Candidatus Kutchimonas denitrificans]NIS00652.1 30S ribosome-binding factor RbfA [Gemmatimonadota bacterium]NIT66797.1 30S ribosome-binding factor RbfA [Gemmatimonadota bacterium]NIV23396.1 30S ribosome-binding factor RbfA [Gemmatimonadota bacterium]
MGKEYSRSQRLAQLLKEEISRLLRREVKDARIGTVIVTDVEVTPDLKYATVYVQVSGEDEREDETLEGLESAAGFVRTRLGRELRIRRAPELRFELDRTQERARRIHELLAQVEEVEEGEEGEAGE